MIPIGVYEKQAVVRNSIEATQSGKEFVRLDFDINGEAIVAKIWLTEKAMGMARQQFKMLGLDPDTLDLNDLIEKPQMLAGTAVDLIVEYDEQYGVQAQLLLNRVDKSRASALTQRLREAKSKKKEAVPTGSGGKKQTIPFKGPNSDITEEDIPF